MTKKPQKSQSPEQYEITRITKELTQAINFLDNISTMSPPKKCFVLVDDTSGNFFWVLKTHLNMEHFQYNDLYAAALLGQMLAMVNIAYKTELKMTINRVTYAVGVISFEFKTEIE